MQPLAPFETDSSWGLKTTTRNTSPFDYDQLLTFFSTSGPLFRLMEAVAKESYSMCEFPIEKLPVSDELSQVACPLIPVSLVVRQGLIGPNDRPCLLREQVHAAFVGLAPEATGLLLLFVLLLPAK